MRILLVVHNFLPEWVSGTEAYVWNLAQTFSKEHDVLVITRTKDREYQQYETFRTQQGKVQVAWIANDYQDLVSFEMFYKNAVIDRIFLRILEEFQPDIIHFHHLLNLSLGCIDIGKTLGIPMVMTLHDYWYMCPRIQRIRPQELQVCPEINEQTCAQCISNWTHGLDRIHWQNYRVSSLLLSQQVQDIQKRNQYIRQQLSKLDKLICPSNFLLQEYHHFGIPREKLIFLEYGIAVPSELVRQKKTIYHPIHFGYIATLIPTKGVHVLLEAFSRLPEGSAELHLYGPDCGYEYHASYDKEIRAYAEKRKDIFFHGEYHPSELPQVFGNIDVLIVPSIWYENSPLVIQEALAIGVPVIGSRVGGIPEKIREGENGFLFEPGNVQELVHHLEYFLNKSVQLGVVSQQAKPIEEHTKELAKLYRELAICESYI